MSPTSFRREEYVKKKRKLRLIKVGIFLLVLLLIFFGLVFLSRMGRFRITNVNLSGNTLVSGDDVSSATKDFLSGDYFLFFPKNNAFLFPKSQLQNMLSGKFKRIETISLSVKNFKTLDVFITERGPSAMWCDGAPAGLASSSADSFDLSGKCYFMNDDGLVFSEAPQFSGDAYFRYYGLLSTSTTPIGEYYISTSSEFADLSGFIKRANDLSLHPIYLLAQDSGQFTVGLSGGGQIYIDTKNPLSKTGDNLAALLQTVSSTSTFSVLNISYIDLRFGNKLFYKLK